jgi:tRNA (guanine37-N1)-methyltransferase
MRIDVITIFPDYLAPLELSLLGRARTEGLVDVHVHDLRRWTHDRHRTVDDTPYGGGAGMVMKPEPWGEALDAVIAADPAPPVLVFPSPAGRPFRQDVAERLAAAPRLVFAAGRYEGIDQRVVDHYAEHGEVEEISLGDYVVNGGEVAVMAIVEAVVRLLPGFMGNPESLAEESHGTDGSRGLLEYPVYTKPPVWRGRAVPDVLLSGHHANVERWRHAASLSRTAARRPDLLPPTALTTGQGLSPRLAELADAPELWTLQRACWVEEAQANETLEIPALTEDLDAVRAGIQEWHTWIVRSEGRLIGSVRGRLVDAAWHVGRLMVAPDLAGRGIGRALLEFVEARAPDEVESIELFTGARSIDNLRMYKRAGYRVAEGAPIGPGVTRLTKRRRPR